LAAKGYAIWASRWLLLSFFINNYFKDLCPLSLDLFGEIHLPFCTLVAAICCSDQRAVVSVAGHICAIQMGQFLLCEWIGMAWSAADVGINAD
jgi:hypothetical protein